MPRIASRVLTAALLAAAGVAAQAPPTRDAAPVAGGHLIPAMVRGEQLKPPGSFYVGGYASAHGGVAATVHLYEHRQGAETEIPVWRPWALREVGRGTALRVEWADGDVCPAVHGVRQMLADRLAPRFRPSRYAAQLPAGGRTPPGPPIVLDGGATVAVWGYAVHPDGAMGAMIFTGREGALLDWAAFATAQLDGCWAATPPPFARPVAAPEPAPEPGRAAPPAMAGFMTPGSERVVGYETFDPEGVLVSRTTLTPRPGSDFGRAADARVWDARRETFPADGRVNVEATTSLDCPGLDHVLGQIAAFEPGRFEVAGVSPRLERLPPRTFDGLTYRLFGPGRGRDQANTRLSVEGSSGEIGALGALADFQLRACWRPVAAPDASDGDE